MKAPLQILILSSSLAAWAGAQSLAATPVRLAASAPDHWSEDRASQLPGAKGSFVICRYRSESGNCFRLTGTIRALGKRYSVRFSA